jgi:hypothetical protein
MLMYQTYISRFWDILVYLSKNSIENNLVCYIHRNRIVGSQENKGNYWKI